jgi:hypothetical protein
MSYRDDVRFRDRETGDLLVIMVAFTICWSVIAGGATIALVEVVHPDADTSKALVLVSDVINTLIGLLAGFLAGRTEAVTAKSNMVEAQTQLRDNQKRLDEQLRETQPRRKAKE